MWMSSSLKVPTVPPTWMSSTTRETLSAAPFPTGLITTLTSPPASATWVDSGTRRNGLSEADLHVPAKLREEGWDGREEAEALPRREIVTEDDLLQLGVAERVQVEVPR